MNGRRRLALAVLGVAALVAAAPAVAGSAAERKPQRKTVKMGDNYYVPDRLTVNARSTITWRWPGSDSAGDVHDVELRSRPKGVKAFASDPATADFSFRRKLTKPGLYELVCTLHEEMTMTIRVRR